jgi:uncharacterized protein (DUF2062 family)
VFPIKSLIASTLKKIRLKLKQLATLRASKHQIALGVGIGVFIGVFPTFGLGAIAIALITPFVKFNVPAALIGTLIANPFTMPLWVFLSCWVVGLDVASIKVVGEESLLQMFRHYSGVLGMYVIGVTIVSVVSGVFSYVVTRLVLKIHFKRKKKRAQKESLAQVSELQ